MKALSIVILLSLCILPCFSQKNVNPDRLSSIRTDLKNKKAKVIAFRNTSDFTFVVAGENLSVLNEEAMDMVSLEGNLNYVKHIFYNNHIKIENSDLKSTNGKSLKKESSCGSYEVEDIFYSDAKVCSYKFNFLHEGTEISFRSKIKYDDPRYLTRVFFHDEVPSAERQISFTIPQKVDVELVENNFEGFNITKTVTTKDGKTVYTYFVKDLDEFKSESNSLGALYYYPHIVVITKKFTTPTGDKAVIASVNDLYKWYSELIKQVKNDPAILKDEVQRLTASTKTPEDKIRAIYYWVQDNIKYIAFEDGIAGFQPEAAHKVYSNRYGDCKGMANLTKEMLKLAGFDARLTWIGTNRIPYTYDLPTLAVDNHMICTVSDGGKEYILDSTEKFIALGKNAERIQGKEMLIENGDKFIRKKVPISDFSSNLVTRTETLTIEGETLVGQGELVLNGEAKKSILNFSTNTKQEDQNKIFDKLAVAEYSNTDKVEITNAPSKDREKPLEIKYSYKLNNKVSKFGNDIYVELDWNKTYQNLKIEDNRVSDYYLGRKVKLKTTKKLKIPVGYKLTHIPAGMSRKTDDYSFEITFKQVGNELIYNNEITIPKGLVKKKDFLQWNDYIKELKEVYNDQAILTKIK